FYLREGSSNGGDGKRIYPVFVVLTHTGTVLSNIIKNFTGNPYSHASISFDSSLRNMYSFGRKFKNNPLIGTFVKEDINAGLFEDVKDTASYSIYVTFVTKKELDLMKEKLHYFLIRKDELKYNFTGLIKHTLGMESEREDAYFCSQFVDTILRSSGKTYFNRHSSLVKPYDFAKHKDFYFVAKGLLKNYDKEKVDRKVQQIFNKINVVE
ncbi:hypothetical protein, partial [Brevibacillus sp. MCWH]|uniref:hypothetical protein n=1 Tax=Brevibacillus sp. MCWH TaxID=2508871 RepID=UPI0014917B6D